MHMSVTFLKCHEPPVSWVAITPESSIQTRLYTSNAGCGLWLRACSWLYSWLQRHPAPHWKQAQQFAALPCSPLAC